MQKKICYLIFLICIVSGIPISFAQQNNETQNVFDEFSLDNGSMFLIFNLSLLIIIILFLKNKLPLTIKKKIKKLFSLELSKRNTTIIIFIIFSLYIIATVSELDDNENTIGDSFKVKKNVENFELERLESYKHIKHLLLHLSIQIFDNIKIIPFIASLGLLFVVYFLVTEITKKRFAGVIAILVILQSSLWLKYDTIATYENFWVLFYFFSIYLIIKRWYLSSIFFMISVLSKTLTSIFLPISLFFIFRSSISKKQKFYSYISYIIIIILGIVMFTTEDVSSIINGFDYPEFISGFKQFSIFMSNDFFILMAILPLTVGLFFVSRNGNHYADSIQMMFIVIFLSYPLLISLTQFNNHDYRMIPIVIAFALGIGTLFSNVNSTNIKKSDRYISTIVFVMAFSIVGINMLSVLFPNIIQGHYQLTLG